MEIIKALNFEERYFFDLIVKYQEVDQELVEKYYHPSYVEEDNNVVHSISVNLYKVNCVNENLCSLSFSERHTINLSLCINKGTKSILLKEVFNENRNIKGIIYPTGPIHEISRELYSEIQNSFYDVWNYCDDKIIISTKLVELFRYLSGFMDLKNGHTKIKVL